ncbi:MAG: sugar phosphate nucleotidyltransferase [Candidatus Woesearchaeota archaeon]|jgi:glucose-1-phosphate thymidylyltransferase
MKLIVPMAGKNSKLNPYTSSTPKPLIHVAGKPLLGHLLDKLNVLKISEAIFIVDEDNEELKQYISSNYKFKSRFILQKERKGVAHAIFGAKKLIHDGEVMILFADTLIDTNLDLIKKTKADGIIWTKQVKDPRQYGVVFMYGGMITQLIEKPDTPISDKAIVGLYYIRDVEKLFSSIDFLIKNKIMTKGEYQLTDAFQLMINRGARLISGDVKVWQDCGTIPNLLETNKYLLSKVKNSSGDFKNTVIIKPVFIEKGAKITNSVIGPNVSIGKNTKVNSCIVTDSIISENVYLENAVLKECTIGKDAKVQGTGKKLNMGESSELFSS